MSVDYHALLWQQLNKSFAEGTNNAFVMAVGKFLLYSDYSLTNENSKVAENNTFELTDACIGCGTNYNPTGSRISILWDQLLHQGKGPQAGPEQQAAFEEARKALYKVWETNTPTPFYQSYIDANVTYMEKVTQMKCEYMEKYGDSWEAIYDEVIRATTEYLTWERLDKEVAPLLKAIDDWVYGPLNGVFGSMRKGMANYVVIVT